MGNTARSFRISNESNDKLKSISEELGISQAQAMEQILSVYELHAACKSMPERAADIEDMAMHCKAIVDNYTTALQIAADSRELAKSDYADALRRKDKMISDMQGQITCLQEEICKSQAQLQDAQSQILKIDALKAQIEALQTQLQVSQESASISDKDLEIAILKAREEERLKARVEAQKEIDKILVFANAKK